MIELVDDRAKGSFRGESSNMQFEDYGLVPWPPVPANMFPFKLLMVDDFAWPCDIFRLKVRGRVRYRSLAVDQIFVSRPRTRIRNIDCKPSAGKRGHGTGAIEHYLNPLRRGGP